MSKRIERFFYILSKKGVIYERQAFETKAGQFIDATLDLVKEDYCKELTDCLYEVVYNYKDYGFDDDDILELIQEYFTIIDILDTRYVIGDKLCSWLSDDFFNALNSNTIKIIDRKSLDENEEE